MTDADPMPDVLDLLTHEHDEVRRLLDALENADPDARVSLLNRFEKRLVVHERVEEEVLYPAIRDRTDRGGVVQVLEAREEHHLMDEVLHDLRAVEAASPRFEARLHVLKAVLLHHLEEEEASLFPTARHVLDEDMRRELARRVDDERERLEATDLGSLRRHAPIS